MKLQYISFYDHEINSQEERAFSPAGRDITAYVANAIVRTGIDVEVVSMACTKAKTFFCKGKTYNTPEGFSVTLPPTFGTGGRFMKIIRNIWTVLLPYVYLIPRIECGSTAIVYHSVSMVFPVRVLQILKRVRVILQVEEVYADVTNNKGYRKQEVRAFRNADAFIFPTRSLRDIINTAGKPSTILHGCYSLRPILTEKNGDGRVHCVYAGTFDSVKGGVMNAIAAAEFLDEGFVIHIIGFGSKENIQRVKAAIEKSKQKSKCEIIYDGLKTGSALEKYIQQCHVGLSTQNPNGKYNETSFPSKVLMYLSNGLKVVSVDLSILKESGVSDCIEYASESTGSGIADAIRRASKRASGIQESPLIKLDKDFLAMMKSMIGEMQSEN